MFSFEHEIRLHKAAWDPRGRDKIPGTLIVVDREKEPKRL